LVLDPVYGRWPPRPAGPQPARFRGAAGRARAGRRVPPRPGLAARHWQFARGRI